MCGIYGKFSFHSSLNIETCITALDKLAHRGPDGYGFQYGDYRTKASTICHNHTPLNIQSSHDNYFIGHRRLSIVDLSENAFQPMCSEDERYSVVFNGEIYNHYELRRELEEYGYRFFTDHSDTEVLLNAYRYWGERSLEKFRGMFAFAIYDKLINKIFLARDRAGQKPLYYYFSERCFIFASELPPIIECEDIRFKIDPNALAEYLAFGYIPSPRSFFQNISKLPPANYGWVDLHKKTIKTSKYWDIEFGLNHRRSFKQWKEIINSQLQESVTLRLRADVPMGIFSSGGIDSTLVLKMAAEADQGELDTFSADFPDKNQSDQKYIKIANEKYNSNLNLMMIGKDVIHDMDELINVFDEPFDGGSSIALFRMFSNIQHHKKIMLTGDGGDELFGGYERYSVFARKNIFRQILGSVPGHNKIINGLEKTGIFGNHLEKVNYLLKANDIDRFINYRSKSKMANLLREPYFNAASIDKREESLVNINDTLKIMQYMEFKSILPGRMLYKLDRMSMYFGIEARSPFMDHQLIESAFQIPSNINVGVRKTKEILKSILLDDFSASFVRRRKKGFGNPIDYWFRTIDPVHTYGDLKNKNNKIYSLIDYDKTNNFIEEIGAGYKGKKTMALWRLIVLSKYIDKNAQYIEI